MNQLNIRRYGDGEIKLVAIHGLGSASTAWDLVQPELQKHLEFITLDLPGHGDALMDADESMNPVNISKIILKELQAIGITKFHLIGNSLGGWIALEIGAKYPESVLSITDLNAGMAN